MLTRLFDRSEKYLADGNERPIHYIAAVVIVGAAFLLRFVLHPVEGSGIPFLLFYPAIFTARWYGGMRPGLLGTAMATVMAIYFIKPAGAPVDTLQMPATGQLLIFFFSGALFSVLMGMMHHIVTKERRSHQEIANQREWFRVTLRSIGDAVMVTNRDGLIQSMNGEAERLSGWSESEAKGRSLRSIFRIINEESRSAVDDPVEKVFREKRVVGLANHTLLLSKDGRGRLKIVQLPYAMIQEQFLASFWSFMTRLIRVADKRL